MIGQPSILAVGREVLHVYRLIPYFDLNLLFGLEKHWKRYKSKHSID